LADAFAAALAKERKGELVTGDPEFKPLEREIKIHWLR
jgi:predicted nucleic acid-binding protein